MARPTLKGLIFTTMNMVRLAKRLISTEKLETVALRVLTQDVLEAAFGSLVSKLHWLCLFK